MTYLLSALETLDIVLIVLGIVIVLVGLICAVVVVSNAVKGSAKTPKTAKEKVSKNSSDEISADTYLEELQSRGDYFVLARNVIYNVGSDGQIAAGKYVLKNSVEMDDAFNLRYNGLVREFTSGTAIVLASGDTLCCVSSSILIKPV